MGGWGDLFKPVNPFVPMPPEQPTEGIEGAVQNGIQKGVENSLKGATDAINANINAKIDQVTDSLWDRLMHLLIFMVDLVSIIFIAIMIYSAICLMINRPTTFKDWKPMDSIFFSGVFYMVTKVLIVMLGGH